MRGEFDELWKKSVRSLELGIKYNRIVIMGRDESDKPLSRLSSSLIGIQRDSQDGEPLILESAMSLSERWKLGDTWSTPCCPKI